MYVINFDYQLGASVLSIEARATSDEIKSIKAWNDSIGRFVNLTKEEEAEVSEEIWKRVVLEEQADLTAETRLYDTWRSLYSIEYVDWVNGGSR